MPIPHQIVCCHMSPLGNAQLFAENMLQPFRASYELAYTVVTGSNVTGMSEVENAYFTQNLGNDLRPNMLKQILGKRDTVSILAHSTARLTLLPNAIIFA
jgi:UDP-glucose 4-epimerase